MRLHMFIHVCSSYICLRMCARACTHRLPHVGTHICFEIRARSVHTMFSYICVCAHIRASVCEKLHMQMDKHSHDHICTHIHYC